jgi:hypothetical protein
MTTGHVLVRGPVESDPLQHKRHQVADCLVEGWGDGWGEGGIKNTSVFFIVGTAGVTFSYD